MSQAVKFLAKLIAIPSISTVSSKKQAIKKAVEVITASLSEIGFQISLFKENDFRLLSLPVFWLIKIILF